jgi:hypothetical protein
VGKIQNLPPAYLNLGRPPPPVEERGDANLDWQMLHRREYPLAGSFFSDFFWGFHVGILNESLLGRPVKSKKKF